MGIGKITDHYYLGEGPRTITLVVTDPAGLMGTSTSTVTLAWPNASTTGVPNGTALQSITANSPRPGLTRWTR